MRRIDAHHHLWQYTPDEYSWIPDEMSSLRRDFLAEDLEREVRAANVDATIAVQARQTIEETRWLLSIARHNPLIAGVVGWLPLASESLAVLLDEFGDEIRLKGLRHVIQAEPAGFLDCEDFNRGIAALLGTGLVYDILILAPQLGEATRFVDRHPQQSFVLDHIAKPKIAKGEHVQWAAAIAELARRPNVVCKISGMVTEARWTEWRPHTMPQVLQPYFDTVLRCFGPHRLMIGTDWPVLTVGCDYAMWWQTVEAWIAPLTEIEREAILGGVAARVYGLDETPGVPSEEIHAGQDGTRRSTPARSQIQEFSERGSPHI